MPSPHPQLGERQKLANALSRAAKDGRIARARPKSHLLPCTWSQTDGAVGVTLLLPGGTPSSAVSCAFDVNSVEVLVGGERTSLAGRLAGIIKPLDSTWQARWDETRE